MKTKNILYGSGLAFAFMGACLGCTGAHALTLPDGFVDENFYSCVLDAYRNIDDTVTDDTALTPQQLAQISVLECGDSDVVDVSGVGMLANLETLNLDDNNIRTMNLSGNKKLMWFSAVDSNIEDITFASDAEMIEIVLNGNEIEAIDISGMSELISLQIDNNKLTELKMGNNTKLQHMVGRFNQLEEIDLSEAVALENLDLRGNQLKTLDLGKNTSLRVLNISGNQLEFISLINNVALESFYSDDILVRANIAMTGSEGEIRKFDLSALGFLDDRTIIDTDDYSWEAEDSLLTVTNSDVDYVQVVGASVQLGRSFKLVLREDDTEDDSADEIDDDLAVPDTGSNMKLFGGGLSSIAVVVPVVGAILWIVAYVRRIRKMHRKF